MTSEELGRLTIAELEAAAARVAAALSVLREAGAWRGADAATPTPRPTPPRPPAAPAMSVAEQAERRRLLAQIRGPELPADIAALEDA